MASCRFTTQGYDETMHRLTTLPATWPVRYGLAGGLFLATLLVRLLVLPPSMGFMLVSFFPAVLLSFYLWGAGPGTLIAVLSAVTGYAFWTPGYWASDITLQGMQATVVFLGTALLAGGMLHRMQVSARSLQSLVSRLDEARQHNEKLLREQSELLNTDLLGMAIVRDEDRSIRWANSAFSDIYGFAPGALDSQPSRVLFPDDAAYENLGSDSRRALERGAKYRTQLEIKRIDGRKVWVDVSGARLAPDRGESIWMILDISRSKEAETSRLRTVELEAENRQILEASRLKGMFLANMSHELRTPLNAIIGLSHLLQTGSVVPGSPRYATYLDNIQSSGQHLLELINATLDLTRIESGRLTFAPQRVNLQELAIEMLSMVQRAAEVRHIQLHAEVSAGLDRLWLDPLRFKQVVLNYLSNAIKFTPEGGSVTLRAQRLEADGFRVEVEDTGIGIAEADIPRLFSEFEQLDAGLDRKYQGSGLGLALTRRLVEAQSGSVGVRSTPGQGSVFWLTLPCGNEPA